MGKLFETEGFHGLSGILRAWRTDPFYQMMEKEGDEGRILGFVKGLRLSAQLIYMLRTTLSSYSLDVDWGHLLDDGQRSCSNECDIIIHKPGYIHKWNGNEKPVMDFKFIKCSDAVAIISCKSLLKSVDAEYCENLKKFKVTNTFLFAECCSEGSVKTLKKNAKKAGYKGFCYMYTIDQKNSAIVKEDEKVYLRFLARIRQLLDSRR